MPHLPVVQVVGAALVRDGRDGRRCLVARRSAVMAEPLKWELPGGKVEPDETPEEALRREIREELGVEIEVGPLLGRGHSVSAGRRIELDAYRATLSRGEIRPVEHCEWGWFGPSEIRDLDWAAADVPILASLEALLLQI